MPQPSPRSLPASLNRWNYPYICCAGAVFPARAADRCVGIYFAASIHWIDGFGFSAELVNIVLSNRNLLAVQWYILIPQGLVFFVVYYLVFRFTIKRFNLLTPGRELQMAGDEADGYDVNIDASCEGKGDETQILTRRYISAIGGLDNLTGIDACIIGLRLSVKDSSLVNTDKLVLSPANGTLVKVFNTRYTFCLETDGVAEVVVHIGIDTMPLNGQSFTYLMKEGSKMTQGQPILELKLAY